MKKQSDTSIRILKDVERKNRDVVLVFPKKKILLSQEDYLSDYFYPGKEFTPEEIKKLEEKSSLRKASSYLHSLLRERRYTVKEVKDRLKRKYRLSENEISDLIRPYQEDKILDDVSYAEDFCENKRELGYGKDYIESKLFSKGISKEILNQVLNKNGNPEMNREIILSLLSRKDKANSEKPFNKRKEILFSLLLRRGLDREEANSLLNGYFESSKDNEDEKTRKRKAEYLKKEAEKCYNAVMKKNLTPYQKKARFLSARKEKGFRKEDIDSFLSIRGYTFND